MSLGLWIAIGVAVGASFMAATGEAYWIGVGVAIGVAMGMAFQSKEGEEKDPDETP